MTIAHLATLRRSGRRPDSVIVIVGKPVREQDGPGFVVIDKPAAMQDLRPLVGLPIHLIDIQADTDFLLAAMAATEEAGVKVLGACSKAGACGVSEKHEHAMTLYREGLML